MLENIKVKNEGDSPYRNDNAMLDAEDGMDYENVHPLDTEQAQKIHADLMDLLNFERSRQSLNRYEMAIDDDYFDDQQYDAETIAELIDRGQAPIVKNLIKPVINWMTGTEKRSRIDWKVLPRNENGDQLAEVKTKLLKYFSDVNNAAATRSLAFEDCCRTGLGWLEEGINVEPDKELIYIGHESWRNILHDSLSTRPDTEDWRYIFRWRNLDVDFAAALFPDRVDVIRNAARGADSPDTDEIWYMGQQLNSQDGGLAVPRRYASFVYGGNDHARERVKIIEAWYRVPAKVNICVGNQQFSGKEFDENNSEMVAMKEAGAIRTVERTMMKMRVALMTESDLLFDGETPYRHNKFPFTPVWGYRRRSDNMPYGAIRSIRDPQDDYNRRASKALWILSSNRIVMEKGAVEDIDLLREEAARPDAIIEVKKGAELRFEKNLAELSGNFELMQEDARLIQDISGITSENLGRTTNAISGKAVQERAAQGTIVTATFFDNLRAAFGQQGRKLLSLAEQYVTDEKVVRIVGTKLTVDWLRINYHDPETGEIMNDITREEADFVIEERDYNTSTRQSMYQDMAEFLSHFSPEVGLQVLDLLVDMSDVPMREALVARIRKMTGQTDPYAKPDPKLVAAQQEAENRKKQVDDLNFRKLESEVALTDVKARIAEADAMLKKVTAFYEALQAGQVAATVPFVTPIADGIVKAAGFVDDGAGQDPNIQAPTQMAQVPMNQLPQLQQTDGAAQGIETNRLDGVYQ